MNYSKLIRLKKCLIGLPQTRVFLCQTGINLIENKFIKEHKPKKTILVNHSCIQYSFPLRTHETIYI